MTTNSSNNNNTTTNSEPVDHYESHSHIDSSSGSLAAKLNSYQYLDDYEYCRVQRLRHNAARKFGLIMQSIDTNYKDCSQSAFDLTENDSDKLEEVNSETLYFNRILKRHRKRFKQNSGPSHHHR